MYSESCKLNVNRKKWFDGASYPVSYGIPFLCLVYFYFELVTKEHHHTFPFINHGTCKMSTWLHGFLWMTVLEYISRKKKCPFTTILRICADQPMSDLDCLLVLIRFRLLAKSGPMLIIPC